MKLPRSASGAERLNRSSLAVVAAYVVLMVALAAYARRWTLETLRADGHDVEGIMVGPTPMNPFTRDVVFSTKSSYRHGSLSIGPSMRLTLSSESIARNEATPLAVRALEAPEVRGFATWARFPWASIEEEPAGVRVTLRDARYARLPQSEGFGTAVVFLPQVRGAQLDGSRRRLARNGDRCRHEVAPGENVPQVSERLGVVNLDLIADPAHEELTAVGRKR